MKTSYRYLENYGNYKSDKYKQHWKLEHELGDLICHTDFSRQELLDLINELRVKGGSFTPKEVQERILASK